MIALIVDDNSNDRRFLRYTFSHFGCTVLEAANGKEALQLAVEQHPDVIISDALMPVMDGFLLLRGLKSDPQLRSIPFVFYTAAYTAQNEVELADALGADAFILKPKQPDELWREVCHVLEGRLEQPGAARAIGEGDEQFLREYSQMVASKLEIKMKELEEELVQRKESEKALRESEQRYRQLNEALEQRVRETVDELRQKDKMLMIQSRQAVMGEMLSIIAHQWRQPLNILGLLAQDLAMALDHGGLSPEHVKGNVKKTVGIINQMSKTIDDFRYFYKSDAEKVEFRVLEAMEKALSLIEGSLNDDGIRVVARQTGDPVVTGYPSRFIQVLLNILLNARDALTTRKVENPAISIDARTENGKAVVTISDNAGGIPTELLEKIFDPYFSTKGPMHGTGIGLFMCKTIVEKNMGGRLSVRNTEQGAEFRIEV